MKTKRIFAILAMAAFCSLSAFAQKDQNLHIVVTGDIHGAWFDEPYISGKTRNSLMSVKYYVDSLRNMVGKDNVILLDAGDALQGDNAAYYYNFIATNSPHLFPRMCAYMGYDAVVVGNHDIETGHPVYDRVNYQMKQYNIPWLAANTVWATSGMPYFDSYKIVYKGGAKVAILGFGNPNMKSWLSESYWSGMNFLSLMPYAQELVDIVTNIEHPDVVVMVTHSGTGLGDGTIYESQGLDLFKSIRGVDLLITSHDHIPLVLNKNGFCLLNVGAKCTNVGHCVVKLNKKAGKVKDKTIGAELVALDKKKVDKKMKEYFLPDFQQVQEFTKRPVGNLEMDLYSKESFAGQSEYMNLIHSVALSMPYVQISVSAPLSSNSRVKAGPLLYDDLLSLYPYENQLYVVKMRGYEIKQYLEYSYDTWVKYDGNHVLRIHIGPDTRSGTERWSFDQRPYNFDSAAGINYTVDVRKPYGSRVEITTLADGTPFDLGAVYGVGMTSYRANGGGDIVKEALDLTKDDMEARIIARYPEIRELLFQFFSVHKSVGSQIFSNPKVVGSWRFVPEDVVQPLLDADMRLVF